LSANRSAFCTGKLPQQVHQRGTKLP
jgi:hypothetical protein